MITSVIKGRDEYHEVLAEISRLIDRDPAPGTSEGERLDLLVVLARDYESRTLPEVVGDPLEAIKFRMEQQGLTQRDLVPYIGSRSKVSEVLSGKRDLSLAMIRALHEGLGISPKSLLARPQPQPRTENPFDWTKYPLNIALKRRWITASDVGVRSQGEALVRQILAPLWRLPAATVHYRQTAHVRTGRKVDQEALDFWTARIIQLATEKSPPNAYRAGSVTIELMREVARLSWSEQGPRLAQEFLAQRGIIVVIEPHLPRTHLDGAAIEGPGGPVIGLTVRHDRLDNFWFCLMHELVHVARHLGAGTSRFYDDLDADASTDVQEQEADSIAGEALVPNLEWRASAAQSVHSSEAVQDLATELRIHPAIVAGRIRHEFKRYRILGGLVGQGEVRRVFPEIHWPEP